GSGEDRWFRSRILPLPEPIGGALVMHIDVSGEVAAERAVERGATHDLLTGLPNRALLLDRLDHAMLRRRAGALSVLLVDVDAFTTVNDSMGSDVGDVALVAVARRIAQCLRGDEWAARFDGDSFVVVLDGYRPDHILLQLAERIRDAVAEPITLAGSEVILTVAVGLALSGGPDQPSMELLREAEEAAQRAGASGRGQIELADGQVRARAQARLDTEQALRRAIANSELRLVYQAEVSLDSGRVIGAEALLRWHRDGGPALQPEEFVRMAEDTGLIVPIGDWVLYEACRAAAQWPVVDGDGLFVAVNLSARQLVSPVLVEMVRMALRATGLPANRLCIELTESAVLSSFDTATEVLTELRAMGVLVALDDFGTGYSSLSYLGRLPVDIVKLDRSFVEQIETDPVARAIVGAVLSLAQSLGLTVVAEGVESETQRERLRELGCDVVQGFSLGRPTEEAEFIDLAVASRAAVQAWRS
ncbi:MAG: putative bifunctional diguanylate cyclase/phosphodiesterase, partial [Acidimicrobiia bacterium]